MSQIIVNNGQQASVKTDRSNTFLWDVRTAKTAHTNLTGSEEIIPIGTLLGRINATGEVTPLKSAAVDGSEFPIGILYQEVTLAIAATENLTYAVAGDVEETKIVFDGADDLDTIVDGKILRDRIGADTVGIKLVAGEEIQKFDN